MIGFKFKYDDVFRNVEISFGGSLFFPFKVDFWSGADNGGRNADFMYSFRYNDNVVDINEVASQSLFTYEENGKMMWEKFDPLGCFKILGLPLQIKN